MLKQDSEALKKQVDRLRGERNSARNDAMRWLEKQRAASAPFLLTNGGGGDGDDGGGGGGEGGDANGNADGDAGVFPRTPGKNLGAVSRTQSAPGFSAGGPPAEGGKVRKRARGLCNIYFFSFVAAAPTVCYFFWRDSRFFPGIFRLIAPPVLWFDSYNNCILITPPAVPPGAKE